MLVATMTPEQRLDLECKDGGAMEEEAREWAGRCGGPLICSFCLVCIALRLFSPFYSTLSISKNYSTGSRTNPQTLKPRRQRRLVQCALVVVGPLVAMGCFLSFFLGRPDSSPEFEAGVKLKDDLRNDGGLDKLRWDSSKT